jgi:hypothetical protein
MGFIALLLESLSTCVVPIAATAKRTSSRLS